MHKLSQKVSRKYGNKKPPRQEEAKHIYVSHQRIFSSVLLRHGIHTIKWTCCSCVSVFLFRFFWTGTHNYVDQTAFKLRDLSACLLSVGIKGIPDFYMF